MNIKIYPLGAGHEIGRSCIIVQVNGLKVMLDCGVHMRYNDERKFPDFKKLLKKYFSPSNSNNNNNNTIINEEKMQFNKNMYTRVEDKQHDYSSVVDLLLISHFHLDHCAALPYFTELLGYRGPILCSQPTKAILPLTLEDFRKVTGEYRGVASILTSNQIKSCIK